MKKSRENILVKFNVFFYIALAVWAILVILGLYAFLSSLVITDSLEIGKLLFGIIILFFSILIPIACMYIGCFEIRDDLKFVEKEDFDYLKKVIKNKKVKLADFILIGFVVVMTLLDIVFKLLSTILESVLELIGSGVTVNALILSILLVEIIVIIIYFVVRNKVNS